MDIEKVKKLAKIANEKRENFRNFGLINIETDPKKRKTQFIKYEVARAEVYKADSDLFKEQTG